MQTHKRALALDAVDNIAVALEEIAAGDRVAVEVKGGQSGPAVEALEDIPFGFKVALQDIPRHSKVRKYGEIIGRAVADIRAGAQVHIHNIEGVRV